MAIVVPNNLFNRRFAGGQNSSEMYQSGYFYAFFFVPPQAFSTNAGTSDNYGSYGISDDEANKLLTATCTSFNPAGESTISDVQFEAMNGINFSIPGNVTQTKTATATFHELSGLYVTKVISQWFSWIRDPLTGVSKAKQYTIDSWAGDIYFVVTKPNGLEIEYCAHFAEARPKTDPRDFLNQNLTASDKASLSIQFEYNMMWDTISHFPNNNPDALIKKCEGLIGSLPNPIEKTLQIHNFVKPTA